MISGAAASSGIDQIISFLTNIANLKAAIIQSAFQTVASLTSRGITAANVTLANITAALGPAIDQIAQNLSSAGNGTVSNVTDSFQQFVNQFRNFITPLINAANGTAGNVTAENVTAATDSAIVLFGQILTSLISSLNGTATGTNGISVNVTVSG